MACTQESPAEASMYAANGVETRIWTPGSPVRVAWDVLCTRGTSRPAWGAARGRGARAKALRFIMATGEKRLRV